METNFKKALVGVIISVAYKVVLNTTVLLFPEFLHSDTMIKTIHVLSFFAAGSVLLAGWFFITETVRENKMKWKITFTLMMTVPLYAAGKHLAGIFITFNDLSLWRYHFSPEWHQAVSAFHFNIGFPFVFWLGLLFLFSFFYLLKKMRTPIFLICYKPFVSFWPERF